MIQSIDQFFSEAEPWITSYDSWIAQHDVKAVSDHICFKCDSSAEYESMRAVFESDSQFIFQSIVSGRRISIIGLPRDINTKLGTINILELSDQKPDGSQQSGFDHIELFPARGTRTSLVNEFKLQGVDIKEIKRPHHTTWDTFIDGNFKARLEDGPLLDKIKNEMK